MATHSKNSGQEKFYITTAIPYVNAPPHLGHALEFVQADVVARYHRQKGEEVLLLSGSDENALKNVRAAEEAGMPVREFISKNAKLFRDLAKVLCVRFDVFQRGSIKEHHKSSQKLWELCSKAGDIYRASYEGLYCVGCEAFYTPDELDENLECFEHPRRKLERISEANYFFKLSRYQDRLVELIGKDELRIIPATRKNEMLAFLKKPLQDISISRSNERAKNWGVVIPGDKSQRMYVWFDALNIYQSGVGFGANDKQYKKWWPADVHVIGKGITRFHAIYWPAFLTSAGLPLPRTLFVHGYIMVGEQKMSKSLGNVVDPFALVERYGVDAVRYFFLRGIAPTNDGDFTYEKFEERYKSDLAKGLGNFTARVVNLGARHIKDTFASYTSAQTKEAVAKTEKRYHEALSIFRFDEALQAVWELISYGDKFVDSTRLWELPEKDPKKFKSHIAELCTLLANIALLLEPFLPTTSQAIAKQLGIKTGDKKFRKFKLKKGKSLFPMV